MPILQVPFVDLPVLEMEIFPGRKAIRDLDQTLRFAFRIANGADKVPQKLSD